MEELNIVEDFGSVQARRWMLTINNPDKSDSELEEYITGLEHIKYAIFQREKGHETGTEHIQAFVCFSIGKRFGTIKGYFPTAHIEKANGTNVQCRDYCSKSDTRIGSPIEIGQFAEERQRTDIRSITELISAGATKQEIKKLFPEQYFKNSERIERSIQEELVDKYEGDIRNVEVNYLFGESGVGKTRYVVEKFGLKNVYRVTDYFKDPWYAYNGQDVVVFEEFRGQFKIYDMLNYLDIYPLYLPARYHNKFARFTKIYITTNIPLNKQYMSIQDEEPETWKAFKRRIHKIYRVDNSGLHLLENYTNASASDLIELSKEEADSLPF